MIWQIYKVVLRLCSPMHIGRVKVGNIQRTRPYVTGRVLWGALTERITRDRVSGPATHSELYQTTGKQIHQTLAFTYLYPTTHTDGQIILWPWDDKFSSCFLSSYASTALVYPQQSADEGTLHEIEFISPHALDTGEAVFLKGYVFEKADSSLKGHWQSALKRLQMGGERGYGWGQVRPIGDPTPLDDEILFDGMFTAELDGELPVVKAGPNACLLAHTLADGVNQGVSGEVEPLVGREVDPKTNRFGMRLSDAKICFAPGATVQAETRLTIGRYGLWQKVAD